MKLSNPKKSVNRESHYARSVRGADHPLNDLNNPVLVVSLLTIMVRKGLIGLLFN